MTEIIIKIDGLDALTNAINRWADVADMGASVRTVDAPRTSWTLADELADVAPAAMPVAVPPPPIAGVDAEGVPWDERIHSASKDKTTRGTWRRRRNLDDETYEGVMAELKASAGAPAAPPTAPVFAAAAPPPVTPPPAPNVVTITFPEVASKLATAVNSGKVSNDTAKQILAQHGVQGLTELFARQDLWAPVSAAIDSMVALA